MSLVSNRILCNLWNYVIRYCNPLVSEFLHLLHFETNCIKPVDSRGKLLLHTRLIYLVQPPRRFTVRFAAISNIELYICFSELTFTLPVPCPRYGRKRISAYVAAKYCVTLTFKIAFTADTRANSDDFSAPITPGDGIVAELDGYPFPFLYGDLFDVLLKPKLN